MSEKKPGYNEEFSWTVHDFSRPKKAVEEVKMEWPKEPERPRRSINLDEPISFDIDVFKKRSESETLPKDEPMFKEKEEGVTEPVTPEPAVETEPAAEPEPVSEKKETEPSPEQKLQELAELTKKLRQQQNMERQAAAQNAMNSSREAAAIEAREESLRKADPFFDFSQTNIAFQDLLDQEYAKLKKMKEGVPYVESPWKYQTEETPADIPAVIESAPVAEPAPELPEAPEDALERMIMEGTSTVNPDKDATIQVDLSAIKKAAAQRYGYESEAELNGIPVGMTETPAEEKPEAAEEPVPVVKNVEEIVEQKEPETPEAVVRKRRTMTEMEKAREEYFKMLDQEMGGVKVKVEVNAPYGQTGKVVADVDIKPATVAEETKPAETVPEPKEETPKTEPVQVEEPKKEEPVVEAPKEEPVKETEEIVWPLDPSRYEDDDEKGGFFSVVGKILLAVIALVSALEIAALAILYFAPDSSMADTVYQIQTKVLDFVDSFKDGEADDPVTDDQQGDVSGTTGEEGQSGETDQTGQNDTQADTAPMADKAALIQTQMDRNKNIKSVTANNALVYKNGVDYGISDLNNSKPITNNIWYTDANGVPVYYDQEVVGTLIAFNSQWIDYVNDGNKAVLDLTKEGSDAYNNAVGFSKAGKVKEEFVSVEIGEIRQGEQGFYLWVAEEIKLVENGVTSTANYQWVYCMEPVGQEMKLVDYISVKNK